MNQQLSAEVNIKKKLNDNEAQTVILGQAF